MFMKWMLRALVALTLVSLSINALAQLDFSSSAYNGKDGPVALGDVDWWGPKGSGNLCWWERNSAGRGIQRHCATLGNRGCWGGFNMSQGTNCDPKAGYLCLTNQNTNTVMAASFGTPICVEGKWGTSVNVDIAAYLRSQPNPGLTVGTALPAPYNCVIGTNCGFVTTVAGMSDIYIYGDNAIAQGTSLAIKAPNEMFAYGPIGGLANGSACAHMVTCQKMLNGDVYPMGIVNGLGMTMEQVNAGYVTAAQLPGAAVDIGVGANGAVWVIGTLANGAGGNEIFRWDKGSFTKVPGAATRISVDGQGNAWITNAAKEIYRWNGAGWTKLPGSATEIAVGGNGNVFVIGSNAVAGGGQPYRWDGSNWVGMPGGLVRLAVDASGNPWGINSNNQVLQWNGSSWQNLPGSATDIGIGADGTVIVTGTDGNPYQWNGTNWNRRREPGDLKAVGVSGKGMPYYVDTSGKIIRGAGVL